MLTVSIYALCDPDTDKVYYVGRTTTTPEFRFQGHLGDMRRGNSPSLKVLWLRKLMECGKKPTIRVLETIPWHTEADWLHAEKREKEWIVTLSNQGEPLTNARLNPRRYF